MTNVEYFTQFLYNRLTPSIQQVMSSYISSLRLLMLILFMHPLEHFCVKTYRKVPTHQDSLLVEGKCSAFHFVFTQPFGMRYSASDA
jgi:hypothetical protein